MRCGRCCWMGGGAPAKLDETEVCWNQWRAGAVRPEVGSVVAAPVVPVGASPAAASADSPQLDLFGGDA